MGIPGPNRRRGRNAPAPPASPAPPRAAVGGDGAGTRRSSPLSSSAKRVSRSPPGTRTNGRAAAKAMKLTFTISSDFTAGLDVQSRIMQDIEQSGFDHESTFAIRLALEEALVNAIKHGNREDPAKKVHVSSNVTPGRAEITVEDEGPGFDRHRVPDPTCDENLCRPNGRGILLIESYMSDVKWERGGRRVRMVKQNVPATPPAK